jgi:hypothetical protein
MEHKKYPERMQRHIFSIPFIYMMIIPMVIFDLFMEVYHRVCFPLYGIPIIRRKDHIRIDRHKLSYLTLIEKVHCAYCGYANGLMSYGTAIAAETEKYWCGIKHAKYKGFQEPAHHKSFIEYGDEKAYRKTCRPEKKE